MTIEFYRISDNSFHRKGMPWMSGAHAAQRVISECAECKVSITEPASLIRLTPYTDKGALWPDAIGCGGGIMGLYVSARVKEVLDRCEMRYVKAFPAVVEKPYPPRLAETEAPAYFYMAGELGAKFDFTPSGQRIRFVSPSCGRIHPDPASQPTKDAFIDGSWNGSDIFYTDLSPGAMYCSDRILNLARQHQWTNFRFVPLDEVYNYSYKGLDYREQ